MEWKDTHISGLMTVSDTRWQLLSHLDPVSPSIELRGRVSLLGTTTYGVYNSNETACRRRRGCTSVAVAMAECGGRPHSMTAFMREATGFYKSVLPAIPWLYITVFAPHVSRAFYFLKNTYKSIYFPGQA